MDTNEKVIKVLCKKVDTLEINQEYKDEFKKLIKSELQKFNMFDEYERFCDQYK